MDKQPCNTKKSKRWENKKRKLDAFLRVASENEADRTKRRKTREPTISSEDSSVDETEDLARPSPAERLTSCARDSSVSHCNTVRTEPKRSEKHVVSKTQGLSETVGSKELEAYRAAKRLRQKYVTERPKLFLRQEYINANLKPTDPSDQEKGPVAHHKQDAPPVFVMDIRSLLLFATEGNLTSYKPRFCRLLRCGKVHKVLVAIAKGLTLQHYLQHRDCFPKLHKFFDIIVPVVNPSRYDIDLFQELAQVPVSHAEMIRRTMSNKDMTEEQIIQSLQGKAGSIAETKTLSENTAIDQIQGSVQANSPVENEEQSGPQKSKQVTRIDLLLSPMQMVHEFYPLPVDEGANSDFVFSKEKYRKVTESSPMFAIDCEMVETKEGLELAWIAVVNEHLEVIYDALVKPGNRVISYHTRYSGMTEKILANVKTSLQDVQNALRDLLPPDAILCGQSFQNDLKAMKMYHPYVIDTSTIFNLSGVRHIKPGLKLLVRTFLNEDIQTDHVGGHSAVEDAIATMKLVQHKLKHYFAYGDVILESVPELQAAGEVSSSEEDVGDVQRRKMFFREHGTDISDNVFTRIRLLNKSVLIVDREEEMKSLRCNGEVLGNAVTVSSDKQAVAQTCKHMTSNDVSWIQLHNGTHIDENEDKETVEKMLRKVDKRIGKLAKSSEEKSLMIVLFSGRSASSDLMAAVSIAGHIPSVDNFMVDDGHTEHVT